MKTFWSLLAKILLIVVVVESWFLYDFYQKNQQLLTDNVELETKLLSSEQALAEVSTKLEQLEKRSLEGMLKETNKAVVSGWETLLNAVQEELNKAKEAIPSIIGNSDPNTSQSTKPKVQGLPQKETVPPKAEQGSKQIKPDAELQSVPVPESIPQPISESIKGERT
ncbi:MAG: hypothetical protein ACRBCI_12320 [Cellvibrionaceae bacterium]